MSGYFLYKKNRNGETTYTVKGLKRGSSYKYRVCAYDANGELCHSFSTHTAVGTHHGKYNASKVTATKTLTIAKDGTVTGLKAGTTTIYEIGRAHV